ncbi:hypothetical protein NQ318_001911 [Aromia moschata]|uniref:Uncharacterized protein n=1 Tax=Aromia moschata TaxID=1265417 RepID=A0AAV8Z432_9CUCU|nr:hypothetical protein NQ318_001911 [Aromia moschata]
MSTQGELKKILNSSLPQAILPGPSLSPNQSATYIRGLLLKNLPSSDVKDLKADLKWQFLLDKHSFHKKSKPKRAKNFPNAKNGWRWAC